MRKSTRTNKKIVDIKTYNLLVDANPKLADEYQIEGTKAKHVDEASKEIQDSYNQACTDIVSIANFTYEAKGDSAHYKKGDKLTIGFSNPTVKVIAVNGKKLTYKKDKETK